MLAAGLAGLVVGVLVMGFIPTARALQSNDFVPDPENLYVELIFRKIGKSKFFDFQGCKAKEGNDPTSKLCMDDPKKSLELVNEHIDQVLVRWTGKPGGSGCAKVGNKEFCW
jgi:hypothetical protein